MLGIHTRDKEKLIKCLLCVTIYVLLTSLIVQAEEWPQCLHLKEDIPHKRHLRARPNLDITLEMSSRITHQLTTHIYRILLQEKLGYARVKIVVRDDYNVETISERLNCLKEDNTNLNDPIKSVIPESMINLEVPVPIDYNIPALENSCVHELGTLSPPGHFGWFIPLELTKGSNRYQEWIDESESLQWTSFKNVKFVKNFEVTDSVKSLIDNNTIYTINGSKTYYCHDNHCLNGWFIPEQCKNNPCALLLAPSYENTKEIIAHIKKMNVLIKVAWVGDNLQQVVKTLIKLYTQNKIYKNFIILSWTPSEVIFNTKDFITVNMPRCDHPNYHNTTDGCFYEIRRSVKFAWSEIKSDNQVYELLKEMSFLDMKHYNSLLDMYDKAGNKSMSEIACDWLKENKNYWTQDWLPDVKKTIYIGGIFPITGSTYTGRGIIAGATMATLAINKNSTILPKYDLKLLVADGQCRADKVMKAFIDYITRDFYANLIGVLGPACSETVEPLAGLSKYYKTITISYSAEGAFFSDRDKYPYFFRTIGENKHYKYVYLEMLKKLGWSRVAALTEDGQKYTEYISHMQELLAENSINFIANTKFPRQRGEMRRYLEDLKTKHARIIIADVFDEIARNVMCEAFKLEMTSKQGYVWFLPTWLNNTWYDTNYFNQQFNESVNCSTSNMVEAVNGYFSMTHAYFGEDDAIMQENITVAQWKKYYYKNSTSSRSNFAAYAYDAVWTYALALDTLMKKDPEAVYELHSTNVTNKLTQIIKDIDFEGASGRIKFRGGVTRFSVINIMQWYKNESHIIGRFHPNISNDAPEIIGGHLDLNTTAIVWLNKDRKKPDDGTLPPVECTLNSLAKFLNVPCEMAIIILNVVIILFLLISLGSVIFVIKTRYDKKFMSTKKYMHSLGLDHLLMDDYAGLDQWEIERECLVLNRKLGEGAFGTVYGGEVRINGVEGWTGVAVKTLKVGSTTEEKLDFLSEAEIMKRFDHKNIVKLIGVCTKIEPVYTVMEFMLYGDLKTYLLARRHLVKPNCEESSEEFSSKKLTSMAIDVARGLGYLAELRYVHRDIACRNCLLSSQRVVKIGDFGMTRPVLDNDYYKFNRRGMLPVRWMAPESLALGVFTPASDIWSFGVLLYEIITFGGFPFQGLSNIEVLDYVKAGNSLTIPQGVKTPLDCLLKNCWNLDPHKRPTASELVDYLANNTRLVHPCIDIPISSVQMEDTGQLDMQLPEQFRKCSSSLSFKNLPMSNGISSASIHSPLKKQQSLQEGADFSNQIESCNPKDPLLRSSSVSGCSKPIPLQSLSDCHEDDDEYYFNEVTEGSAMSKV